MVQDWDIYQVGLILGAVRDFVRKQESGEFKRHYQSLELALATVSVSTGGQRANDLLDAPSDSDEYFLARILLGILQRGRAPLWHLHVSSAPFCPTWNGRSA